MMTGRLHREGVAAQPRNRLQEPTARVYPRPGPALEMIIRAKSANTHRAAEESAPDQPSSLGVHASKSRNSTAQSGISTSNRHVLEMYHRPSPWSDTLESLTGTAVTGPSDDTLALRISHVIEQSGQLDWSLVQSFTDG